MSTRQLDFICKDCGSKWIAYGTRDPYSYIDKKHSYIDKKHYAYVEVSAGEMKTINCYNCQSVNIKSPIYERDIITQDFNTNFTLDLTVAF